MDVLHSKSRRIKFVQISPIYFEKSEKGWFFWGQAELVHKEEVKKFFEKEEQQNNVTKDKRKI